MFRLWYGFLCTTSVLFTCTSGQLTFPDEVPLEQMSPHRCRQYPSTGNCHAQLVRYYYNVTSFQCEPFAYSGCGGNDNRFSTYPECFTNCVCAQPLFVTPCMPSSVNQIYYDTMSGQCRTIPQEMCQQNGNVFNMVSECQSSCSLCDLAVDSGPCIGSSFRYYFDRKLGRCVKFKYGGCGGNANNFNTLGECSTRCKTSSVSLRGTHNTGTTSPPGMHVITLGNRKLPVFGRHGRLSEVTVLNREAPTHVGSPHNNHGTEFSARGEGLAVFHDPELPFQISHLLYEPPDIDVVPTPEPEVTQASTRSLEATTQPAVNSNTTTNPTSRLIRLKLKFAKPIGYTTPQPRSASHHQTRTGTGSHSWHQNTGSSSSQARQPTRMTTNGHSFQITAPPSNQISKSIKRTTLKASSQSSHQRWTANPGSLVSTGPLLIPNTPNQSSPSISRGTPDLQGQGHAGVSSLSKAKPASNVSPEVSFSKIPAGHITTHGVETQRQTTNSKLLALAQKLIAVTNVLQEVVGFAIKPIKKENVHTGTSMTHKPTHSTTENGGSFYVKKDSSQMSSVVKVGGNTSQKKSVNNQKIQTPSRTENVSRGRQPGSKSPTVANRPSGVETIPVTAGERITSNGKHVILHPRLPIKPQPIPQNGRQPGSKVYPQRQPTGNQNPSPGKKQPLTLGPLAPQAWDWMRQRHMQQHQQHHQQHRETTANGQLRPRILYEHPPVPNKRGFPSPRPILRGQQQPTTSHKIANTIPAEYLAPKPHSVRSNPTSQRPQQWSQRSELKPQSGGMPPSPRPAPVRQWHPPVSGPYDALPEPIDPGLPPEQYLDAMDTMLAGLF